MPSFTMTLSLAVATLAALATAAPHAQVHAREHQLTPRAQSPDGTCGGKNGFTCGSGFCCSQWGYCGSSDAYCAAGCQSSFGSCKGSSSSSSSSSRAASSAATVFTTSTVTVRASASGSASSTRVSSSSSRGEQSSTLPSKATTFSPTTTFVTVTATSTSRASTTSTRSTSTTSTRSSTSATAPSSTSSSSSSSSSGLGDTYKLYLGDGTTGAGWPAQSSWTDFESMWSNNLPLISISCTQFGQENNSDEENDDIKSAIQSVASSSGVDARFILAVMMQESKGCVRTPTTNYGVNNPGLMQSHDGAGSCNNGGVQDPCPQSEITQMIKDGATGTAAGDGLEQTLSEAQATDVSKYYKAARIYNSGSIAASGKLEDGIATHCYASDIANRLTGWVNAQTKCTLG